MSGSVIDRSRLIRTRGVQLDPFGDHLLGCGHGVLRIQRHDALRDIVYHALRMDNPGVRTEQRCQGDHQDRPGDIFHPDFQDGRPAYFDVTVRNTLQPAFLAEGAIRPGVAAEAGEAAKDLHHAAAVEQAGGVFLPLAVESFGVWTPHSLETLKKIATRFFSPFPWKHSMYNDLSQTLFDYNTLVSCSTLAKIFRKNS